MVTTYRPALQMLSSSRLTSVLLKAQSSYIRPAWTWSTLRSSSQITIPNAILTVSSSSLRNLSESRPVQGGHDCRQFQVRHTFSFAGPRKLDDIFKLEQIKHKSKAEISDLWMTYHESKDKVHGLTLDGSRGKSILSRAALCPFFIQPIFRDEGHFMIISQFQPPNCFLLAFLEDYRMDPSRAQPLLTISIFDDLVDSKDLALMRCDIINAGIEEDEGYKICRFIIRDYSEEQEFTKVHMFNKNPDSFDVDAYVEERKKCWIDNFESENDYKMTD